MRFLEVINGVLAFQSDISLCLFHRVMKAPAPRVGGVGVGKIVAETYTTFTRNRSFRAAVRRGVLFFHAIALAIVALATLGGAQPW